MVEQLRRHRDHERRPTGLDPSSGGANCPYEFRIIFFGYPSGGDIVLPMKVKNSEGTYVSADITIGLVNPDGLKTALVTHPEVTADQVETGGPGGATGASLPKFELWFKFKSGILTNEVLLEDYTNNLDGGNTPHALIRLGRG